MTNFKTALIAGLITFAGTSAFANDGALASAPKMNTVVTSTTLLAKVMPVKAPVLHAEHATTRRVARVVYKPVAIPVVRKANMTANRKFIFTSPTNTNAKTFRPSLPKNAAMPNLFKK